MPHVIAYSALGLAVGLALGWLLSRVRLSRGADLGKLDLSSPERRRFLIEQERRSQL